MNTEGRANDRSPTDYALEFAEYLAKGAEQFIDAVNLLAQCEQQRDELDGDEPEGIVDATDHAVDSARDGVSEFMSGLRNYIYEFRKRRDRAAAAQGMAARSAETKARPEGQQPGAAERHAPNNRSTPGSAPTREALTDEQIERGRRETFSTENPFCPCDSKTMRKAVRWAERAHGIGVRAALATHPSAPAFVPYPGGSYDRPAAQPAAQRPLPAAYVQQRIDWERSEAMRSPLSTAPAAHPPAVQPASVLPPLPSPVDQERVYGGHGNEVVHLYFSETQMREYARQSVYLTAEAQPTPNEPARYRLLQRTDLIEPADEFLAEDGETWAVDPGGLFVGTSYAPAVLRPARRPLRATPEEN